MKLNEVLPDGPARPGPGGVPGPRNMQAQRNSPPSASPTRLTPSVLPGPDGRAAQDHAYRTPPPRPRRSTPEAHTRDPASDVCLCCPRRSSPEPATCSSATRHGGAATGLSPRPHQRPLLPTPDPWGSLAPLTGEPPRSGRGGPGLSGLGLCPRALRHGRPNNCPTPTPPEGPADTHRPSLGAAVPGLAPEAAPALFAVPLVTAGFPTNGGGASPPEPAPRGRNVTSALLGLLLRSVGPTRLPRPARVLRRRAGGPFESWCAGARGAAH